MEPRNPEDESDLPPPASTNEPSESSDPAEECAPAKPKSRRRCSDLSNLEQWGWHKNKRYSTRKKSNQEKEVDTSVNGYLRKIFARHFEETFDTQSPFLLEKRNEENGMDAITEEDEQKADSTMKDFETEKKEDFEKFLKEARESHLDLILIIYLWIKYVSNYWNQELPEDIKKIYYEIYGFYLNHYDLVSWNMLSNEDFNTSYSTTLFFLEMDIERENATFQEHCREINAQWKMLFYHLKFNSGNSFVVCEEYDINMLRLFHLEYAWAKFENRLNNSSEGYVFSLPNFKDFKCSTLENVTNLRVELQRKIGLKNVKTLYENNKFEDLVEILKDSLIYSTTIKNSDDNVMKLQTQFEVLLESFWNVEKYEECLVWSERCLKYSVDNIVDLFPDTFRYKEWADCINFILVYIEELILKDGFDIT
uniref:Uncharacterized protein n=1 Tax=Megaselia scalaris TaxID=36166 RepID=T1GR16_MEGSC